LAQVAFAEGRRLFTKIHNADWRFLVFAQDTMSSTSVILLLASLTVVSALVVQRSDDPFANPKKAAKKMWEMEEQWNDIAARFVEHAHVGAGTKYQSYSAVEARGDYSAMHDKRDCEKAKADFQTVCQPYTLELMQKLGGVRATDSVNKYFKNVCYAMPKFHKGKKEETDGFHKVMCAASHDKLVRRMLNAKTATAQEKLDLGLPTKDSEIAAGIARDSCGDLWNELVVKVDDKVSLTQWKNDWNVGIQEGYRRAEGKVFARMGLKQEVVDRVPEAIPRVRGGGQGHDARDLRHLRLPLGEADLLDAHGLQRSLGTQVVTDAEGRPRKQPTREVRRLLSGLHLLDRRLLRFGLPYRRCLRSCQRRAAILGDALLFLLP